MIYSTVLHSYSQVIDLIFFFPFYVAPWKSDSNKQKFQLTVLSLKKNSLKKVYCLLYRWKEISRSECSSNCGKGVQKVTYRCSQEFNNISISHPLPEGYCSHLKRPNPTDPCHGPCDKFQWQYYDWEPVTFTLLEKLWKL